MAHNEHREAQPYNLTTVVKPIIQPWCRIRWTTPVEREWLNGPVDWDTWTEWRKTMPAEGVARYPMAGLASAIEGNFSSAEVARILARRSETDGGVAHSSKSDDTDGSKLKSEESYGCSATGTEILQQSARQAQEAARYPRANLATAVRKPFLRAGVAGVGEPDGEVAHSSESDDTDSSELESEESNGSATGTEILQQSAREVQDTALRDFRDWLQHSHQQLNNNDIEASIAGFGPAPFPANIFEIDALPGLKAACRTYALARAYVDGVPQYRDWHSLRGMSQLSILREMLTNVALYPVHQGWVLVMKRHCREYFAILQRYAHTILPETWEHVV